MSGIHTITEGDVLVVRFDETRILDQAKAEQIGAELLDAVDQTKHGKLLLNLDGVQYMSSAMLGKLMQIYRDCTAQNIRLAVCSIAPEITQVLKVMQLPKVLEIHTDQQAALAAFEEESFLS